LQYKLNYAHEIRINKISEYNETGKRSMTQIQDIVVDKISIFL